MRTLLPVATAVFALTSTVHGIAKASPMTDAQIHLYPFMSFDCTGEPYTSPVELKQGECVNIHQALSLKPRFRSDHAEWVNEVNELRTHCKLITYSAFGCSTPNRTEEYRFHRSGDLPRNFEECLISRRQNGQPSIDDNNHGINDENPYKNAFYSAKFVCDKLENPGYHCTSTVEHTFWSMDPTYGAPHPSVSTGIYTGSLSPTASVAPRSIAAEETHPAIVKHGFKPGHETKPVWMLHPWSHSLLCYSCYPAKEHDYTKIECRHGKDYPANCGLPPLGPDGEPTTAHTTTTETTTRATTTHTTLTSDLDIDLPRKGSWHTPVKFPHPFVPGKQACADAEWEKRGQGDASYIKIQHVHICDKKDRDDSQWIGLPEPVTHTLLELTTPTSTIKHISIVRHDQL